MPQASRRRRSASACTLSLTGPIAAPGAIQKVATEVYVDDLNRRGGLLGRKVELVAEGRPVAPRLARTLYEQLITVDKVDLIVGPYGTAIILVRHGRWRSATTRSCCTTASARRARPSTTCSSRPPAARFDIEKVWPNLVFDAAAAPTPPKTIAIVTSKFPSLHFVSLGAREVAKKRGLTEVLFLEYEFGNRDFGPIASRLKDAKPDFIWFGAGGIDGVLLLDAMKKIDYAAADALLHVPGARPDGEDARGEERARLHHLRGAPAVHQQPARQRS